MDQGGWPLGEARDAHARRDFGTAYDVLSDARRDGGLDLEDLNRLADAAWWLGRIGECLKLSEELHERYLAQGRLDQAAMHALDLAFNFFMRGEQALGSGWLSRGTRLLEDQPLTPAHCLLVHVAAEEALAEMRLDDATSGARELQEHGRALGDPTFVALGLLMEGLAEVRRGHLPTGFALMDEAMLPVVADEVRPEIAGHIYCTILSNALQLADLDRARRWVTATERWCGGFSDAVMFLGVCRAHRSELLALAGAWDDIERDVERVRTELAAMNTEAVAEAEYHLGESLRLRGRLAEARACFRRARELGRDPQPGEALADLHEGDVDAAWTGLEAATAEAGPDPFRCARLLRAQVEVGLACGRVADAARAASRLDEIRRTYGSPGFEAWADQAVGTVRLAEGGAAAAVDALTRALAGFRRLRSPYDVAVTLAVLAAAQRAAGDEASAEESAREASAGFRRLGIEAPRQIVGVAPGGLTHRELEVLVRVAAGVSNREAAQALFISEATVRRHLANIYAKLGVATRTAAAAWAHEQGLLPRA